MMLMDALDRQVNSEFLDMIRGYKKAVVELLFMRI